MESMSLASHVDRIHAAVGDARKSENIEEYISRSWRRCLLDYKLDPSEKHNAAVITDQELRERRERSAILLPLASAEMTNLYEQVAGSGYAILLTDSDGVVLNYVGDPIFENHATQTGLMNGAVWTESVQGTNGMGTCLVEKKPVVVHHDSHFFASNTVLTCTAAPIRNPDGTLAAVLDASSTSRMAQQHTMALVRMSAQLVENRLFLSTYNDRLVARFHSRPEFVSTIGEGLLAFDADGRIVGVNRSALFQLNAESSRCLIGRTFPDVFDSSVQKLLEQLRSQPYSPVALRHVRDGKRFFVLVQQEDSGSKSCVYQTNASSAASSYASSILDIDHLEFGDPRIAKDVERAKQLIEKDIPLLIYGPTGTGKGVFAKALHMYSSRRKMPFVPVNCAAIPETLIESELFGYKAGAFTGANRKGSKGKIVQANGGTLFLDEIGDMPLALQARLLRVLEEREVVPLGGDSAMKVDICVISATHRDLRQLIELGKFREDLYYRLHGIALTLPPLRERADKQRLIQHLFNLQQRDRTPPMEIDDAVMLALLQYEWPGNVRELCTTLRAMTALCRGNRITVADLPNELQSDAFGAAEPNWESDVIRARLRSPLATAEYSVLLQELETLHWNISKAARKFGVSRNTLYRKMRRFGITPRR